MINKKQKSEAPTLTDQSGLAPAKCSACGGAWIIYPLYNQCQKCFAVWDNPNGWMYLMQLQRKLDERKRNALKANTPND